MVNQKDYKRKDDLKYLIPQINKELKSKYPNLVSILDLDRTEIECIHDINWNGFEIYERNRILLNLIVYKKKGIRKPLIDFVQLDDLTHNENGPKIKLVIINDKDQESSKLFELGDGDDRVAVQYQKNNKAYIWLRWWKDKN